MLDVKVDRSAPVSLHDQVAAAIRRAVADGEAQPGDRLPPARDLAAELSVNTNTVLRALRQLRDEGIVEFRRGRGVTVTSKPQEAELISAAQDFVRLGSHYGYQRHELINMLASI